jgi:hypothetical protein
MHREQLGDPDLEKQTVRPQTQHRACADSPHRSPDPTRSWIAFQEHTAHMAILPYFNMAIASNE